MILGDSVQLSLNVVDDVRVMLSYPFMVNAFRAGTIVAVVAAVAGWFMVLRRQAFAGHTLALVGFPGATLAAYLGVSTQVGFFGFCALAALLIAALPEAGGGDGEPALIGTIQAVALAAGLLFVSLRGGNLANSTNLLFGTLFGVTSAQVVVLAGVALVVVGALCVMGRPLLFASVDTSVAAARGVPTRVLSVGYLVLLGVAAAEASQVTGALLVFALLVLPPAAAQRWTARPGAGIALSIALAVLVTWFGLTAAFFSPYPSGFWITSAAFAVFVVSMTKRRA